MKKLVAFFEIPAVDFSRAVKFYETILEAKLTAHDWEKEKMAFFADNAGAISWAEGFNPSKDGVLVHLSCDDISKTLALVEANGGGIVTAKTQIQSDNAGYFALFIDSEGKGVCYWRIKDWICCRGEVKYTWRNTMKNFTNVANEVERLFRRLKGFRRVCTRYERLDVMYLAFMNLALIYDELKLC